MGWEQVLGALVREHSAALVRTAYLLCGDRDSAEDLVQEAYVRTLGRFRGAARAREAVEAGDAQAYLRRAILHLYLDGYRRRKRWQQIRHLAVPSDRSESAATAVEARLDATKALAQLPPRVRACVVLRYYDDLPVAAVAEELGLAEGSVKRYLADGRVLLAAALGETRPESTTGGSR